MPEIADKKRKKIVPTVARKIARRTVGLNASRLRKMIAKLMDNLEKEESSSKASISELLKLLQVYKDLTAEQVKEVEVRWVDRLRPDEEQGK